MKAVIETSLNFNVEQIGHRFRISEQDETYPVRVVNDFQAAFDWIVERLTATDLTQAEAVVMAGVVMESRTYRSKP